jgi:dTDP-4-dehydrorhamnose reductase/SAM-dependent methyltransferase
LTGGSGLLGTELRKLAPDVLAPRHAELDIADQYAVSAYIASHHPDTVIHAAAITNNREVEHDPTDAVDVNIKGTANIALACLKRRTRLVYLSTDYVYRGDNGNYSEDDEVAPFNLYAWTKLGGECSVASVPNHLIIRTSFGAAKFEYSAAFSDKFTSKAYVDELAPQVLEAARSPLTGILNIGSARRSMYEYAKSRNPDVRPTTMTESPHHSPADTSLNTDRWRGYRQGRADARSHLKCRVCGNSDLRKYLDLGMMPLANNLASDARAAKSIDRYPLQVSFCDECGLSQTTVIIDPSKLFGHYTYRSSISKGYVKHCRDMARSVGAKLDLKASDLVVDIAGNDGALLGEFKDELGVRVINVDPAENICAIAEERGVPSIVDFWSTDIAQQIIDVQSKPRLITATNVFAHVDDVRSFLAAASHCLQDDGALVLEFPYVVDFIEHREFDTVYFEHLSYVGLKPVMQLAAGAGMQVFDVERHAIHGGSLRVFIGKEGGHDASDAVHQILKAEKKGGYHDFSRYEYWSEEIDDLIADLTKQLRQLQENGSSIAAFGAAAKGNTLLNACRLNSTVIGYIVDDTPEKIGNYSPGTGIPVVDRSRLSSDAPDYLVILAWNFADEIIASLADFRRGGGKFIIPVPEFQIVV